ncbi:MAG: hypothetical protein JSV80_15965 [Acidobacteriota bacterium]|nr:MAG: hypothetical protein JSV80_15965 [Acidobacteriota bacterium]
MTARTPERLPARTAGWLRRAGAVGLLFFLLKGMLWLLVPAAYWLFL